MLVGLWRTDGPLATKLTLALLWPIGPLAFLITISGLVGRRRDRVYGPEPDSAARASRHNANCNSSPSSLIELARELDDVAYGSPSVSV